MFFKWSFSIKIYIAKWHIKRADMIGDLSYFGMTLREKGQEPDASAGRIGALVLCVNYYPYFVAL